MAAGSQVFSESPCGPACVPATDDPPRVGLARYLLRRMALSGTYVLALAFGAVATVTGRRAAVRLLRLWSRVFMAAIGVRVEVIGDLGSAVPVLAVTNHVTVFDPMALLSRRPFVPVITDEAKRNPIIGPLLRGSGTIFLRRGKLDDVAPLISHMTAALRAGHSVAAAPEGRVRCSPPGGVFKPASLQCAVDTGVPVRPLLMRCRLRDGTPTSRAFLPGTWSASLRNTMRIRGLVFELRILQDIDATATGHRKELARRAKQRMDEAAANWPTTCAHSGR